MIKLKELLKEAPQIKKVKNVSVQYFGAEYAGEMAFSGYFRKAWLYEKDNGEWFAIVITKNKNRYQIELGKHKNKLSADKAAEKIIKRNLNKFESVNESRANVLKAIAIAKKMGGNMTGAVKKIEKIQKGLSKQIEVEDALKKANESVNEKMNPRRYSEIKGQARYLAMEMKSLNKAIRTQNDKDLVDSIDYILGKAKMMKEILGDKRYD